MKLNINIAVIFIMIVAFILRLCGIIPNFSPIIGVSLLGAAYFTQKKLAFVAPILFMYTVDFIINNTFARAFFPEVEGVVWLAPYMIWNYVAYFIIIMLGIISLQKATMKKGVAIAVVSSLIFYAITNTGAWIDPKMGYPAGAAGWTASMIAGLPFLRTSMLGDVIFTGVLFGAFEYYVSKQSLMSLDKITIK